MILYFTGTYTDVVGSEMAGNTRRLDYSNPSAGNSCTWLKNDGTGLRVFTLHFVSDHWELEIRDPSNPFVIYALYATPTTPRWNCCDPLVLTFQSGSATAHPNLIVVPCPCSCKWTERYTDGGSPPSVGYYVGGEECCTPWNKYCVKFLSATGCIAAMQDWCGEVTVGTVGDTPVTVNFGTSPNDMIVHLGVLPCTTGSGSNSGIALIAVFDVNGTYCPGVPPTATTVGTPGSLSTPSACDDLPNNISNLLCAGDPLHPMDLDTGLHIQNDFSYDLGIYGAFTARIVPSQSVCCDGEHDSLPMLVPHDSARLGDKLAKVLKVTRLDRVAKLYEELTGRPCRCPDRQALLNRIPKLSGLINRIRGR